MSIFGEFAEVFLEFYVGCHRCGYQNVLVIHDLNREDKQASPSPNYARRGRDAAGRNWSQIMYREVGCRYTFGKFELREDSKGGGRVDQRGNRAAMNGSLVLLQLVANIKVNADFTPAYLAQLEAEKLCVRHRGESFAGSGDSSWIQFTFAHSR
jgi:hypothetical protein